MTVPRVGTKEVRKSDRTLPDSDFGKRLRQPSVLPALTSHRKGSQSERSKKDSARFGDGDLIEGEIVRCQIRARAGPGADNEIQRESLTAGAGEIAERQGGALIGNWFNERQKTLD